MDRSSPSVARSAADVSGALTPRAAEISADIYQLIVREIPQLRGDGRVMALLEASVGENVTTALHVMQHGIDLENVHSPAAAEEYARRLAQRGIPIAALLRAYRIGATRFQDWCLEELGRRTGNASVISAAGLRIADVLATYIETLGSLADDDHHHAMLRETLRVFLHEGGSFKATAERLTLHKNTVQYRVRKAEQSLGRPVGEDRLNVGLALLASQWLGAAVLRQAR